MKYNTMTDRDVVVEMCRRMKERRVELRLSQGELAQAAHIGIATLKRIEAGHPANLMAMVAIIRALGCVEQLEPLLFSREKPEAGAPGLGGMKASQTAHRVRKKTGTPKPLARVEGSFGESDGYVHTAQNNVSWSALHAPKPSGQGKG